MQEAKAKSPGKALRYSPPKKHRARQVKESLVAHLKAAGLIDQANLNLKPEEMTSRQKIETQRLRTAMKMDENQPTKRDFKRLQFVAKHLLGNP